MKVGINFTDLIRGKIGGMENYMRSVLHYFPKVNIDNTYVIFAHREIEETLPKKGYEIVYIENYERNKLSLELKQKIKQNNIDVWWSSLLILDPLDLNIPSAFTIPDMQHEYYPEFFTKEILEWRREHYQLSALAADVIFTISESSKSDICKYLNIPSKKVVVTYLDSAPWFTVDKFHENKLNNIKKKYNLDSKYIFFPANTWPHKNHKNLVEAFLHIHDQEPDITLLLTGFESNAHEDLIKQIKSTKLSHKIKFLGYIDKEEMPYIYKGAEALVFPSLFEGFGIPVVEAMRSDCPVICSKHTSISEVAGNACLFFDPKDPKDIAEKTIELLQNNSLKENLVKKGKEQAKKFSYKECTRITLNYLEKLYLNKKASIENEMPLISIVTPSYNQGKYIRRTIDSVLNQNYPNIEYVVIDGGSNDETVDILKSYGSRLRWISRKDKGQANAINKGLRIAKGEIVAWLNSDDTYEQGTVAKVVKFFKNNPEAKFVHGNGHHIDVDDKFIERYPSEKTNFERFYKSCPVCQPTTFWKKEITNDVGLLNENWNYGMDYDYWIRISKKYEFHFLKDHLANTRVYADTKTFSDPEKPNLEAINIIDSHYEQVSSEWIYAYAHARLHKHARGTRWSELMFRLKIIMISKKFFSKYNGKIPKQDQKMMWNWLKDSISSLLKHENRR